MGHDAQADREAEMSRRYRDLAAWRLGRPLEPWETVHH